MIASIFSSYIPDNPTRQVGYLGVTILVCGMVWVFVRWLFNGPSHPDPWDAQVAAELEKEETLPLCHRCLVPHSQLAHFCPQCGAAVGTFTNLLPFPYLFSIGHTLRIGTDGDFKHSPLTISGFFVLGFAQYSVLAPVYWFMLIRGLSHPRPHESPHEPQFAEPPPGPPSNEPG